MAEVLADRMKDVKSSNDAFDLSGMPYNPDSYWIVAQLETKNGSGEVLYRSRLTEFTDLLIPKEKYAYLVEKRIPQSRIWLKQDSKNDVLFRVLLVREEIAGGKMTIRIGKPIEDLEEELIELGLNIGISLIFCALVIFILSYVLAGRILRPISAIIKQSGEISDQSLDKRIPLSKTRDELYELSVALNNMFDRIQNSFNRQKEFVGNASHELKSPITLLMIAQEDMLMSENLSPAAETSLMKQLETSHRMSHLVKNLLDLSRMEQQDVLHKSQVDLTLLIKEVIENYTDMLAEKRINVLNHMDSPGFVTGDPEKLFRLFVNLIDNAIRYNLPDNGTIEIRMKKFQRDVYIEILNSGLEIPDQDIPRLFEQFYRVEKSRSQALGGSGLGLAIAQKIVSLHHGRIAIHNAPGLMIQVTVCLPSDN